VIEAKPAKPQLENIWPVLFPALSALTRFGFELRNCEEPSGGNSGFEGQVTLYNDLRVCN